MFASTCAVLMAGLFLCFCLFVCLFVSAFVCLFVCFFVCLFVFLFVLVGFALDLVVLREREPKSYFVYF